MTATPESARAKAHPTKAFFVSMLTRDISLADAILDLVDNSLDGALRVSGEAVDYSKFSVEVTIGKKVFTISDNCGGIPREVAINYAFKMGRDSQDQRDHEHETIGMYGIGMKRAVFKLGRSSAIRTRHEDDQYRVRFDPAWLDSSEWDDIPLEDVPEDQRLDSSGTKILVEDLHPGVSKRFESKAFADELAKDLGDHFTTFIQRGFAIRLNGSEVKPTLIRVLFDPDGPRPFYYQGVVGKTVIRLTIGINPGVPLKEDDDGEETRFLDHRSLATSGWTVFCNDRAVLVGDKSRLTGWGDGVPLFHPQFSILSGIVEFRSNDAEDLPVTTTKRALDTSSESWLVARSVMRDGLRVLVSFTNGWKNIPKAELQPRFEEAKAMSLRQVAEAIASDLKKHKAGANGQYFDPAKRGALPKPPKAAPSNRRIVFSRPKEQVESVAEFLLDDGGARPGLVGEASFDRALDESKRSDE